ncbi:MAG: glycosyltransferase family 39 protein, partial [Acidobacteriaceae bacterium]|nr:glycosyltransferase family 39 protein [Acidobacteriaceae bacterium]
SALSQHPGAYTLSLGHIEDLTLTSFAYLRVPLAVAAVACVAGCLGTLFAKGGRALLAAGLMMVLFFHAARLALVGFDPYMSSRPLANALLRSPEGKLIVNHHYYEFSSIFFYTNRQALLLNGRVHNLVYGSYAPNAPPVFIDDPEFNSLWAGAERCYFIADEPGVRRIENQVAHESLNVVASSGGKFLLTNHPLANSRTLEL